jgi:hypothetical protein
MNNVQVFVCILALFNCGILAAPLGEEWESKMLQSISAQKSLSPEDSIPRLGKWIYQLSVNSKSESADRPVYHASIHMMISIPGHAEFYDKRIREHLQRAKKSEGTDRQFGFANAMMDHVSPDFRILSLLPSPETVRVLGELLSEDWVILRNGERFNRSLAGFAMSSLHRMPFVSKPVQGNYVSDENDLETYRLWYAQIKAGNRTFRFEGDPNEYSLSGPVTTSPEPATTPPPRPRDSVNVSPSGGPGSNPSAPWLALTLGGTLIGGALWYWIASRRGSKTR